MKIELNSNGFCSDKHANGFFRVECWSTGRRIADFTTSHEAHRHAIDTGRVRGRDNKVVPYSFGQGV